MIGIGAGSPGRGVASTISHTLRKTVAGRHSVRGVTNIFGRLAKCATCSGSLVIGSKARAKSSTFRYLKCANAVNGLCADKHYHRVDHAETDILRFLGELKLAELRQEDDPATPILAEIDNRTAKRQRMQTALTRLRFSSPVNR
jgi:hypothetical protein